MLSPFGFVTGSWVSIWWGFRRRTGPLRGYGQFTCVGLWSMRWTFCWWLWPSLWVSSVRVREGYWIGWRSCRWWWHLMRSNLIFWFWFQSLSTKTHTIVYCTPVWCTCWLFFSGSSNFPRTWVRSAWFCWWMRWSYHIWQFFSSSGQHRRNRWTYLTITDLFSVSEEFSEWCSWFSDSIPPVHAPTPFDGCELIKDLITICIYLGVTKIVCIICSIFPTSPIHCLTTLWWMQLIDVYTFWMPGGRTSCWWSCTNITYNSVHGHHPYAIDDGVFILCWFR